MFKVVKGEKAAILHKECNDKSAEHHEPTVDLLEAFPELDKVPGEWVGMNHPKLGWVRFFFPEGEVEPLLAVF